MEQLRELKVEEMLNEPWPRAACLALSVVVGHKL